MVKRYLKQTWELMRQNKTFSLLYIAGTAVPLALTMIVVMYFHILISPVYPESHRDNLYELKTVGFTYGNENYTGGSCGLPLIREWFYPLKSVEAVTAIYYYNWSPFYIQLPDGVSELPVKCQSTDPDFFKVFDFRFIDGGPFSESDFHSRRRCAVLAASTARRLFGTEKAAGRHFTMDYLDYTVTGVVRDASMLTPLSYGQVYQPYTCLSNYDQLAQRKDTPVGPFTTCFLVRDKEQGRLMLAEIDELVRKFNLSHAPKGENIELSGPMPAWKRNLVPGNTDVNVKSLALFWGGLILLFLFVPALNLSGMIANRMESRQSEMGICKAFGGSRLRLLRQVIRENLLFTLVGGILGLAVSWSVLTFGCRWVIRMFNSNLFNDIFRYGGTEVELMPSMLFSPRIFLSAFLFCVVLNLASALIPAWKSLRRPIVESLNNKK